MKYLMAYFSTYGRDGSPGKAGVGTGRSPGKRGGSPVILKFYFAN
jgi:hypothetical protein